jgi:GNAT superfamily N-acetyltransferase
MELDQTHLNMETVESRNIKVTQRLATDADTEFARKVHHAAYHDVIVRQFGNFDEKMQDDFFAKSWKPGIDEILMSEDSEAGYCSIERSENAIIFHELVLLPEYQGKGIGSKVLQEVMEEAKTKNIPIKLEVLKENQAQHLYRKLGFKDTGSTDTHIEMEFNPTEKTI